MEVEVSEHFTHKDLEEYSSVDPTFRVDSYLEIPDDHEKLDLSSFREISVNPYYKNYDSLPGNNPTEWGKHFELERANLFILKHNDEKLGSAIVLLEPDGTAVLWDLRIKEQFRRMGAASSLLLEICKWCRFQKAGRLFVEAQNNNVAACRFYARHGFTLSSVEKHAYSEPTLKHEIRLNFTLEL